MKRKHLIFLIFLFFISCNKNVEIYFSNYEALKVGGYLSNDWVPELLPDNSYEIRIIHNLDNNHVFGTFQYWPNGFESLIDSLDQAEIIEFEKLLQDINKPIKPEWFLDNEILHDKEVRIYKVENFIFIVNKLERQAYFVR